MVFALAAAFSNAVNLMTQHSASTSAPKREKGWRLVAYLVRQPLWLLGCVAAVGSFAFQALALHNGQLSVVQPILVTELIFVLVLRRVWIRQDVARAAWAAVLVVCVALAVFLTVAEPTGGHPAPETAEWLSAVFAFGGSIAVLAAAGTRGSPVRRAALFAMAAALTWALMATFIKAATDTLATFGIAGMLTRWPVYALAATAVTGTARAGRSARRAVERVPAGSGHHRPVRQHHLERVAVRRALHPQPAEDCHRRPGFRRHGRRCHRAVPNGAGRPHPVETGPVETGPVVRVADACARRTGSVLRRDVRQAPLPAARLPPRRSGGAPARTPDDPELRTTPNSGRPRTPDDRPVRDELSQNLIASLTFVTAGEVDAQHRLAGPRIDCDLAVVALHDDAA